MRYLISICICLLLVAPCMAETINVDANGSVDFNNIQAAINAAFDGDTVLVADGTYTGPGNRDIDFLGKAITVRSESGREDCIIDCQGSWEELHRAFYFHNNENHNALVEGFTITNGNEWRGGGIYCEESSPTITNCMVIGNSAWGGGGIACVHYSSPTISNCTITGNSAWFGGGIASDHSSPTITNCTIIGNSVVGNGDNTGFGGGIYSHYSSPIIANCTISGNSAEWSGGGICCHESDPNITNCTITSNTAGTGGGIGCGYRSNLTITNCTITGNSAYYCGGGIFCRYDNNTTIANCTFAENSSSNGNALACDSWAQMYPSSVQVTNCILWDGGDEIWNNDGSTITITYSDIQDGYEVEGNIDADPYFVEPGYWDTNSTPDDSNDDFWVEGDYYLLPDSPCIDSGDNNSVPADIHDLDGDGNTAEPLPFDLDGNPRFVDRPDIEDTGNGTPPIVDMGAYEAMVSCFGVNHVKLGTKAGKKGNKVEVKGTFDPASPIDFAVDDVTYTIDDGLGYMLTFIIPAGSFEQEGKPDKQKFRFHSAKGSQQDIKARFDFLKCKFELKVKGVMDTSEITAETLAIVLQAGANIAQEIVELEVKGKKGEHLEYKRKPKFECCPEM